MTIAEILLQDYDVEAKNTRTTLERVPAHLAEFKPHEKSMAMGRLAMHIATLPRFATSILTVEKMDLAQEKFPPNIFESSEATVRTFEHTDETGTYAVHENCTGEAEIDFPKPPGGTSGAVVKLFFVISDEGRQLNTIVTSITPPNSTQAVPANIHSDAVRVSH